MIRAATRGRPRVLAVLAMAWTIALPSAAELAEEPSAGEASPTADAQGSACISPVDGDVLPCKLAAPSRSEEDRARDAGRRPAEVIAFLGIEPGMTVMDLVASGGWYTEVLSIAVGDGGTVYAQNPPMMLAFRDGYYDKAIAARLDGDRLPNVVRLDRDLTEAGLPPGSLDGAITALNFHDIHNGMGEQAATGFLMAVKALLKPGGVLGLIDHYGESGNDNNALHRLDVATALPLIEGAGFEVEASNILRNPDDDYTKMVFDEAVQGKTDRLLLRLTKPLEEATADD